MGTPTRARSDAIVTMRPQPASFIGFIRSRLMWKAASTLTAKLRRQSSGASRCRGAIDATPAEWTKISTGPPSASAARPASADAASGSARSTGSATPSTSAATASISPALRAVTATLWPSSASRSATARPMPRPPPVIRTRRTVVTVRGPPAPRARPRRRPL